MLQIVPQSAAQEHFVLLTFTTIVEIMYCRYGFAKN